MKILYYNWIQFDNSKNIGGGVNVYQRNLIEYLVTNTNNEFFFLSSGWKYNPLKRKTYIRKTENIFKEKCQSFEIINSSIMAPAYATYMTPEKYITDTESCDIFDAFISKYGPFDVIHFNTLEGISVNVLKLKEKYPQTKFIVPIHNYQMICPLNQYFQNHNKCICDDFKNGEECPKCNVSDFNNNIYYERIINYYGKLYILLKPIKKILIIFKFILELIKYYSNKKRENYTGSVDTMCSANYFAYRNHNIEMLNKYSDYVLAVSDRVRQIMIKNGCESKKIYTSYIGTKIAENELGRSLAQNNVPFTIAYLGYERIDKGFFFFVDALCQLDESIARNVNVVLAVANIHNENIENLVHFNKITVYNGYTHKELPSILSEVNLGVVPVLWEDNLPQVAIEMVALGVPILASDFGGASELCTSELFKFKGGDKKDFTEKLINFILNPLLINAYWENHKKLITMAEHYADLHRYYIGEIDDVERS